MKHSIVRLFIPLVLALTALSLLLAGCGGEKTAPSVPQVLQGSVFIYDELESGAGDSLYTLSFGSDGYILYRDGGTGILSVGSVQMETDGSLAFSGGKETFSGLYSGGSFRAPSLRLQFSEGKMTMVPATETTEDVYQAFLGVYEGTVDGRNALLERWKEFYLCLDGELTRGGLRCLRRPYPPPDALRGQGHGGSADLPGRPALRSAGADRFASRRRPVLCHAPGEL